MSTEPIPQAVERHRATGALAIQADQNFWNDEQKAALIGQLNLGDASNGDLAVFLTYAQRTGLDPWARQIYMIARWDGRTQSNKYTIQASIDGLRIVAQRTGDYAGQVGPEWCGPDGVWRDVWLYDKAPSAARVGVLRRGWAQPQYAVALFREYAGTTKDGNPTKMWHEKPALMIAKCAEALALRKAFPQDLSGIYTSDEMSKADVVTSSVVNAPAQAPARPAGRPAPVRAPLHAETVREAILAASSRADLKLRLKAAGAASEERGWHRDDLEAIEVADEHGAATSAWDLFCSRYMDLDPAAQQPAPPAPQREDTVDAELVEDDTAEHEPSAGSEHREATPKADPARRHPAVSTAMANVRASAARQMENDDLDEEMRP